MTPDAAELHRQARALLRPVVYDYYAGGSGREAALRANEKAWRRVRLRPRIFRDVSAVDTSAGAGGGASGRLRTPLAVAPTAFHRLAHPDGEVATATGAARAGALYVMSTRCSRRIEDVAAASADAGGTWWFQVYLMRDRDLTAGLVRRAAAAGARALVLTADTPVVGRPGRNPGRSPGDDMVSEADFLVNLGPLADLNAAELARNVSFTDISWLAEISGGLPVVVKGVLRPEDAEACLAHGAAGVVVSNHGGRQLDQAVPTAWALPGVAATVRRVQAGPVDGAASVDGAGPADGTVSVAGVSVDGGVRRAEDALGALVLGAQLVFLGRPVLWALACGGADGVQSLLDGLTNDLAHVMAVAGAPCLSDLPGLAEPVFPAGPGPGAMPPLPGAHPRHNVEW